MDKFTQEIVILFFLSCSRVKSMSSRVGLLLLACNLFICSIPRCDVLRAAVQDTLSWTLSDDGDGESMHHCHESSSTASHDMTQLSEPKLCKFELLRFVWASAR
jgi:hypothetical protein